MVDFVKTNFEERKGVVSAAFLDAFQDAHLAHKARHAPGGADSVFPDIGTDGYVHQAADGTLSLSTPSSGRIKLTSAATYYVATTGSDVTGTGTSGNPWATIQHAYEWICANLDTAGYIVTIQLAAGTYSGGLSISQTWMGGGPLVLSGATATASNYVIATAGYPVCITSPLPARLTLQNLQLQSNSHQIYAQASGPIYIDNVTFTSCSGGYHILAGAPGVYCYVSGNYSITGGALAHVLVTAGAEFYCYTRTITLTGTPAFSTAFLYIVAQGFAFISGNTFSGSATGSRYAISNNGVASTNGATLPGNASGTTATGGQYS